MSSKTKEIDASGLAADFIAMHMHESKASNDAPIDAVGTSGRLTQLQAVLLSAKLNAFTRQRLNGPEQLNLYQGDNRTNFDIRM
jgi:hypothetical protein